MSSRPAHIPISTENLAKMTDKSNCDPNPLLVEMVEGTADRTEPGPEDGKVKEEVEDREDEEEEGDVQEASKILNPTILRIKANHIA